jgi:hypothetical protein
METACLVEAIDGLEKHAHRCIRCGAMTRIGPLKHNTKERRLGRAAMWPEDITALECTATACGYWILPGEWVAEARAARQSERGLS